LDFKLIAISSTKLFIVGKNANSQQNIIG